MLFLIDIPPPLWYTSFMDTKEIRFLAECPDYQSIQAFVEESDTGTFTSDDLNVLNYVLKTPIRDIKKELEGWGMRQTYKPAERQTRGFNSNDNDRWTGPGSAGF